jgi:hypothetical protein
MQMVPDASIKSSRRHEYLKSTPLPIGRCCHDPRSCGTERVRTGTASMLGVAWLTVTCMHTYGVGTPLSLYQEAPRDSWSAYLRSLVACYHDHVPPTCTSTGTARNNIWSATPCSWWRDRRTWPETMLPVGWQIIHVATCRLRQHVSQQVALSVRSDSFSLLLFDVVTIHLGQHRVQARRSLSLSR